jgi:hypothetical protein
MAQIMSRLYLKKIVRQNYETYPINKIAKNNSPIRCFVI